MNVKLSMVVGKAHRKDSLVAWVVANRTDFVADNQDTVAVEVAVGIARTVAVVAAHPDRLVV